MSTPRALRQSLVLRLTSAGFLIFWCLLAAFPIFWIAVMSFKSPVDAFAANPLDVMTGPETKASGKGLSIPDIVMLLAAIYLVWRVSAKGLPRLIAANAPEGWKWLWWIGGVLAIGLGVVIGFATIPPVMAGIKAALGTLGEQILGLTTEH